MTKLLMRGSDCSGLPLLAGKLAAELGTDAQGFGCLAPPQGQPQQPPLLETIDEEAEAAIRTWQSGIGVFADGILGPRCLMLLELLPDLPEGFGLKLAEAGELFPNTKPANIARYLPYVEAALAARGLARMPLLVAALAVIRAESEGFVPMREAPTGAAPQDRWCGRGFVRLRGRAAYARMAQQLGVPLLERPELANAPEVAAAMLAELLGQQADKVEALVLSTGPQAQQAYAEARSLIDKGRHGMSRFMDVLKRAHGLGLIGAGPAAAGAADTADRDTTPAAETAAAAAPGTEARAAATLAATARRTSNTRKDAADLRDREFVPPVANLPPVFPRDQDIADYLPRYSASGLVLNQGDEGACTGFGLSCVINYLRWRDALRTGEESSVERVSPRMLYTLARRYDEFEGEDYDGSSCRGALKGWFNHGVCPESWWRYQPQRTSTPRYGWAREAARNTLGVYYRVDVRSITDLQAAIRQTGAVFVSAYTHDGWQRLPARKTLSGGHRDLPLIDFDGYPSLTNGHAFALVGFNERGFVLQNSWGTEWGAGGFAVIGYQDWLANAMDAWVVSLGVPGVVSGRLALGTSGQAAPAGAANTSAWWTEAQAYQHSIVFKNDGRIARFLTEDEPTRTLQQQAFVLPDRWFRTRPADEPKRLVIYAHGGLNSEEGAIRRARAMGRYFTGNGCYPLFLVWKTGLLESLGNMLSEALRGHPGLAGGLGDAIAEAGDRLIETTVGRLAARPIWSEMKENAGFAFAERRGGEALLQAVRMLQQTWKNFELHLVGHSAGAILLGHLLDRVAQSDALRDPAHAPLLLPRTTTVHLYAPACTVEFANRHYAPHADLMKRLHLDVLSDGIERDDNVGRIYRKSLLYLVSNALERDRRTPLLGLWNAVNPEDRGRWDGSSTTAEALRQWREAARAAKLADRTTLLKEARIAVAVNANDDPVEQVDAGHGCFDNNVRVVRRTLQRILDPVAGAAGLAMPVTDLRGF